MDLGEEFDEIVRLLKEKDPETVSAVRDELAKLTVRERAPRAYPEGWYVVRVELVSGRDWEPQVPPGRDLLVSPQHTFRQLATAIDASFARWDLSHLSAFELADGSRLGTELDEYADRSMSRTKVGRREIGEEFTYEFDFGDSWMHRCTVTDAGIDPDEAYGARPKGPVAIWGWGAIPDQYGRTRPDSGDEGDEGVDEPASPS